MVGLTTTNNGRGGFDGLPQSLHNVSAQGLHVCIMFAAQTIEHYALCIGGK